ncbi:DUF2294 domain-containing protein [Pseudomonas sp. IT-P258]|jgi:aromatic ring-opening dioxygenase catalytic subunit (LigB family)|uniref:hypothetical protein n=1 Tax=unclassified Pseudomonas TaxID=196821 RepID=UPI0006FFB636|nr:MULTISPECIES: hypothetical protein [unclassified Pseudomonas]KRA97222.1 hypothetical protein ASD91_27850 [Pseudomonas sp. Root68]KRB66961.1 hypothetical protein ASD95_28095 [Pseudomonas sp. Root71]
MKETDLIGLLREISNELKQAQAVRGGTDLRSIIENYERVVMLLLGGNLTDNLIRFSPREYLAIYSDYENPLLEKMDFAQREVNGFLVVRP